MYEEEYNRGYDLYIAFSIIHFRFDWIIKASSISILTVLNQYGTKENRRTCIGNVEAHSTNVS